MTRIIFVGEVDCGKSTLIGRLLYDTDSISSQAKEDFQKTCQGLGKELEFAYLLDSFQEERQDEFTLDTTQAILKAKNKEFLLIDVPGHRELIKNMLTGSSYADAAVLVVDVKKSLEEQTQRHLYILKFLEIDKSVVVINKMDSVYYNEGDFQVVKDRINLFLDELRLKANYFIPISAKEGENLLEKSSRLNWYKGPYLFEALDTFLEKENIDYDFRFPIQDIYEIKKEKIVIGTVASGRINKGDTVKVSPLDLELKVKAIKVFGENRQTAEAKKSVGLAFDRLSEELSRGQVLYKGKASKVTNEIQAKIFCLRPLSIQEELTVHCATQQVKGAIRQIKESIDTATLEFKKDTKALKANDAAQVAITTGQQLSIEKFRDLPELGRFILQKDNEVSAIGIII